MILKALYDYYHRSGNNVAPLGLEYKEFGFTIVIDKDGNVNPLKHLLKSKWENLVIQSWCLSKRVKVMIPTEKNKEVMRQCLYQQNLQ